MNTSICWELTCNEKKLKDNKKKKLVQILRCFSNIREDLISLLKTKAFVFVFLL